MFNVLKIESDPEIGSTEVSIKIPGFQNFGQELEDLQDLAAGLYSEEGLATLEDTNAAMQGLTEHLKSITESSLQTIRKQLAEAPEGTQKERLKEALRLMEEMNKDSSNFFDADDDDDVEIVDDEIDPEALSVSLSGGTEWNDETQGRVEELLKNWPSLRSDIQKAVFIHYRTVYPAVVEFYQGSENIDHFLPKPSKPDVVLNLFRISTIHLLPKNMIGLTGSCIWDDEHGVGIKIKGNKVIEAGNADIVC